MKKTYSKIKVSVQQMQTANMICASGITGGNGTNIGAGGGTSTDPGFGGVQARGTSESMFDQDF